MVDEGILPPVKWAVVVQETHETVSSGGSSCSKPTSKHLHAIISFCSEIDVHDPNLFDRLSNGLHGNYAGVRNLKRSLEYLRKEDSNPLEWGDRKGEGDQKSSTSREVAELLMKGTTTQDLIKLHPGFFLMNGVKINAFKTTLDTINSLKSGPTPTSIVYSGSQIETGAIVTWLEKNFLESRAFKQKQLYVWGPPNSNKTSLLLSLGERWSLYWVATLEDFYNDYRDEEFDAIVFDEFVTRDLPTLNKILEGGIARLRTKGGQVVKKKNVPVIILSNGPPEQWFKNNYLLAAFLARIQIVELSQPIETEKINFI